MVFVQIVLQRHHATVSVIHAFTKNPEHLTREADIVITAAGVPNLVRGNWLKPGAVVIDVGTNPVEVIYGFLHQILKYVVFGYMHLFMRVPDKSLTIKATTPIVIFLGFSNIFKGVTSTT